MQGKSIIQKWHYLKVPGPKILDKPLHMKFDPSQVEKHFKSLKSDFLDQTNLYLLPTILRETNE